MIVVRESIDRLKVLALKFLNNVVVLQTGNRQH